MILDRTSRDAELYQLVAIRSALERVTHQRVSSRCALKLGARLRSFGVEFLNSAIATFSTEAYWLEFADKNAEFIRFVDTWEHEDLTDYQDWIDDWIRSEQVEYD